MAEQRQSKPTPAEILAATRRYLESQGPESTAEPLREWLERNPDAERPSIEEAEQIVRELLADADLSELPPMSKDFLWSRWVWIGKEFPHHSGEALRNWISASKRDPDYWDALKIFSARMLRGREPLPDALREWITEMLLENLTKPKGKPGRRPGTNDNHNMWIGHAVSMLLLLGMNGTRSRNARKKESACDAVKNYLCSCSMQLSYEAVVSAWRSLLQDDGHLPEPWEV